MRRPIVICSANSVLYQGYPRVPQLTGSVAPDSGSAPGLVPPPIIWRPRLCHLGLHEARWCFVAFSWQKMKGHGGLEVAGSEWPNLAGACATSAFFPLAWAGTEPRKTVHSWKCPRRPREWTWKNCWKFLVQDMSWESREEDKYGRGGGCNRETFLTYNHRMWR